MIRFVHKVGNSWVAETLYDNVEPALSALRWGTVPHPVSLVVMKIGGVVSHFTEAEFRARYLPPARG